MGCGSGSPIAKGLVPASGVLLLDGNPIGGATIMFNNDGSSDKPGGSCITKEDGSFTINTFGDGDGAFPGTYMVTLTKAEVTYPFSDDELLKLEAEGKDIPPGKVTETFPKKYLSKGTTDITITIPEGGNKEIKIEAAGK